MKIEKKHRFATFPYRFSIYLPKRGEVLCVNSSSWDHSKPTVLVFGYWSFRHTWKYWVRSLHAQKPSRPVGRYLQEHWPTSPTGISNLTITFSAAFAATMGPPNHLTL